MPKVLEVAIAAAKQYRGETLDAALRRGMSVREATAKFRLGTNTVCRVRDSLGIPPNPAGSPGHKRNRRGDLAALMGTEPFKATERAATKDEVNRRELGGMVARVISSPTPPAEPAPVAAAPAAGPSKPKAIESTWKVTVRRRLPAAELHRRLQALMALLTETEGEVQADVYVADIVEVGP